MPLPHAGASPRRRGSCGSMRRPARSFTFSHRHVGRRMSRFHCAGSAAPSPRCIATVLDPSRLGGQNRLGGPVGACSLRSGASARRRITAGLAARTRRRGSFLTRPGQQDAEMASSMPICFPNKSSPRPKRWSHRYDRLLFRVQRFSAYDLRSVSKAWFDSNGTADSMATKARG